MTEVSYPLPSRELGSGQSLTIARSALVLFREQIHGYDPDFGSPVVDIMAKTASLLLEAMDLQTNGALPLAAYLGDRPCEVAEPEQIQVLRFLADHTGQEFSSREVSEALSSPGRKRLSSSILTRMVDRAQVTGTPESRFRDGIICRGFSAGRTYRAEPLSDDFSNKSPRAPPDLLALAAHAVLHARAGLTGMAKDDLPSLEQPAHEVLKQAAEIYRWLGATAYRGTVEVVLAGDDEIFYLRGARPGNLNLLWVMSDEPNQLAKPSEWEEHVGNNPYLFQAFLEDVINPRRPERQIQRALIGNNSFEEPTYGLRGRPVSKPEILFITEEPGQSPTPTEALPPLVEVPVVISERRDASELPEVGAEEIDAPEPPTFMLGTYVSSAGLFEGEVDFMNMILDPAVDLVLPRGIKPANIRNVLKRLAGHSKLKNKAINRRLQMVNTCIADKREPGSTLLRRLTEQDSPHNPVIPVNPSLENGEAACRYASPKINFWPDRGESTLPAQEICHKCKLIVQCAAFALDEDMPNGIFGGLTARQRRRIRSLAAKRTNPMDVLEAIENMWRADRIRTAKNIRRRK